MFMERCFKYKVDLIAPYLTSMLDTSKGTVQVKTVQDCFLTKMTGMIRKVQYIAELANLYSSNEITIYYTTV